MSATNVTVIRDWGTEVLHLTQDLQDVAGDVTSSSLAPGYRMLPATEIKCQRLLRLLGEALALLEAAVEQESPRYEEHCIALEARGHKFT